MKTYSSARAFWSAAVSRFQSACLSYRTTRPPHHLHVFPSSSPTDLQRISRPAPNAAGADPDAYLARVTLRRLLCTYAQLDLDDRLVRHGFGRVRLPAGQQRQQQALVRAEHSGELSICASDINTKKKPRMSADWFHALYRDVSLLCWRQALGYSGSTRRSTLLRVRCASAATTGAMVRS